MSVFQKGMTLIEVLIVVVIIGIIGAIAIPSYNSHIEKSRRVDGQRGLVELQLWLEQYYTENKNYPNTITCGSCTLSNEYTYSIKNNGLGADRFVITADVKSTGLQKNDPCKSMSINAAGNKSGKPNTQVCWN